MNCIQETVATDQPNVSKKHSEAPDEIRRRMGRKRKKEQLPRPQPIDLYLQLDLHNVIDVNYRQSFQMGHVTKMFFPLFCRNPEYMLVQHVLPPSIHILGIYKVVNPYLQMAFNLKRELHYKNIVPKLLFHGTKDKYVDNICTYNFNWRFSGTERGHRYGKGVNFSPCAHYASFFCDKTLKKVIIASDVLISEVTVGRDNLEFPPEGYDTTARENGLVLVKYNDNEFCPRYVIEFMRQKDILLGLH